MRHNGPKMTKNCMLGILGAHNVFIGHAYALLGVLWRCPVNWHGLEAPFIPFIHVFGPLVLSWEILDISPPARAKILHFDPKIVIWAYFFLLREELINKLYTLLLGLSGRPIDWNGLEVPVITFLAIFGRPIKFGPEIFSNFFFTWASIACKKNSFKNLH